jgi:RNA polymerase sigma-70 factor (ECF subfamily)
MPVTGERLAAAYRREAQSLLVFFVRRTYDAQAAADLVAETFAAALAGRRSVRGTTDDELDAWLRGIARNQLARYYKSGAIERRALRRLPVERAVLDAAEIERIEELAALSDLRAQMAGGLAELPADCRDAVRLRVIDELDYPAVAERLGISEPAARARVSRGLRRIASSLTPASTAEAGAE